MMRNDGSSGRPDCWTTYLSVPDASATSEAAAAAGGQVHLEPMQVGPLGAMGLVAGPDGAVVGLWQPGEHHGHELDSEPGAPCWHELHTRDYAGSLTFYSTVFGWQTRTMSDEDDFRYTNMVSGDGEYAGVMDASGLAGDAPAAWTVYFGAEDVDATVARAVELGGSVLAAPQDTPFGRLAHIADPTGASIRLIAAPAPS